MQHAQYANALALSCAQHELAERLCAALKRSALSLYERMVRNDTLACCVRMLLCLPVCGVLASGAPGYVAVASGSVPALSCNDCVCAC